MPLADIDYCELHVTIKDYFTSLPYIDAGSGLTSADLPYEACQITQEMYEPKTSTYSTATVTFPSLIARPELRPLLQLACRDGARVEFYAFQPDVGEPVFAGYIPPDGVTEDGGNVQIAVDDTIGRGKWWHVRRVEEYDQPVSDYYTRGTGHWQDVVNEDFTSNPAARWSLSFSGGNAGYDSQGFYCLATQDYTNCGSTLKSNVHFSPSLGDMFLMDFDVSVTTDFHTGDPHFGVGPVLWDYNIGITDAASTIFDISMDTYTRIDSSEATPLQWQCRRFIETNLNFYGDLVSPSQSTVGVDESLGVHFTIFVRLYTDGTASMSLYRNNVFIGDTNFPWPLATAGPMCFFAQINTTHANTVIRLHDVRLRQLVPYLGRAARFVPQSVDATYYQANQDDTISFLNLFVEKDGAEYRALYHSAPQLDELELDGLQTLGANASAVLGYGQPGSASAEAPKTSPRSAVTDAGAFAIAPPFRFEEGFNLASTPRRNPPALGHANEVIRMGSSQLDAQIFADVYANSEVGGDGVAPQYPYFETLTNDDRVGLISLNNLLAKQELTRRLDRTPSLEIDYVETLDYAFRWREGDTVYTKTLSLLNNVDQTMRVARVVHSAGTPVRTVTLGKLEYSADMLRELGQGMLQQQLFDQSGSSGTVYVYPNLPVTITAGATSPAFTITLDQITTGTQIIYAGLHWQTGENGINEVSGLINSGTVTPVNSSGQDSGLSICTGLFPQPGKYTLQFKNTGAASHTLTGAFLVIRIKM